MASKAQARLALNQPFMPVKRPQVRVPESATLIGDRTHKPYLRVGDNPNEPEMMSVAPVSMAFGGTALVGGTSGYDPNKVAERRARTSLSQARQLRSASRNVADIRATGQAQLLQNQLDRQYAEAGVSAPVGVNVAMGTSLPTSSLVRVNPRTQEQLLAEDFASRNAITNAQDDIAAAQYAQQQANQANLNRVNLAQAQQRLPAQGQTRTIADDYADYNYGRQLPGPAVDEDGNTLQDRADAEFRNYFSPGQDLATVSVDDLLDEMHYQPQREYEFRTELRRRGYSTSAIDILKQRMDRDRAEKPMKPTGELAKLTDTALLEELYVSGGLPTNQAGPFNETSTAYWEELKRRGFSDRVISVLLARIQREEEARVQFDSDYEQYQKENSGQ